MILSGYFLLYSLYFATHIYRAVLTSDLLGADAKVTTAALLLGFSNSYKYYSGPQELVVVMKYPFPK